MSGDVSIAYKTRGEGPPDLFMFPVSAISFESIEDEPGLARTERRLASFSRLIRSDRRGTGLSDRVSADRPGTMEDAIGDSVAVLDAVGSSEAAVVGTFLASRPAIALAVAHPERVSHLIVINGVARMFETEGFPYGIPAGWDQEHGLDGRHIEPDAVDHGTDVLRMMAPTVADDPAFRSWWDRAGNLAATPAMAAAFFQQVMTGDVRALLPEVRVPTLVIDRPDAGPGVSQGRYLAEHIPGAELLELPGQDLLYWVGETAPMLDAIEEFVTGVRGGAGVERVLATVLFTDIVGSTDLAAGLGDDRWRDLLDRHDKAVRTQIERFDGREVNTTGDGFVATFTSPGRAIECGLAISQALAGSDVGVRAGVHTGEVEVRGEDIAGMAVHIGARVAAKAGAGEVLVSSTVRDLVAGSRFSFRPEGEHELKGVPGTWSLYTVEA